MRGGKPNHIREGESPGVGHSQGRWAFPSGWQEAASRPGVIGAAWEWENG